MSSPKNPKKIMFRVTVEILKIAGISQVFLYLNRCNLVNFGLGKSVELGKFVQKIRRKIMSGKNKWFPHEKNQKRMRVS